jgi:K(+)-stimulated pyrophosphate-energized sodium pump
MLAFSGGAVMGLSVARLGLIGIGYFFMRYAVVDPSVISGFARGASSIALFARVGGGIFTKRADVGSDPVGKKDTSGPSMNILIQLMSVVALVLAPLLR